MLVVYQYVGVVHFYSHFSFSGRCWSYSLIVDIWRKEKKLRCIIVCLTAVILMLHVLSHMTRVSRCVKLILHIYVLREIHPSPFPVAHFNILVSRFPGCVSTLQIRVLMSALMYFTLLEGSYYYF